MWTNFLQNQHVKMESQLFLIAISKVWSTTNLVTAQ